MTRTALALALLSQGCIIYEEHYVTGECQDSGCDTTWTWTDTDTTPDPTTTDTTTDWTEDSGTTTTDPGPTQTGELELTVSAGYPGDQLLSSLVSVGTFDLGEVVEITFERDVAVLDTMTRADEVVLLLSVASDAAPGPVEVFVETADGGAWLLEQPFEILEESTGGTTTEDTGGHGTTDTGCP